MFKILFNEQIFFFETKKLKQLSEFLGVSRGAYSPSFQTCHSHRSEFRDSGTMAHEASRGLAGLPRPRPRGGAGHHLRLSDGTGQDAFGCSWLSRVPSESERHSQIACTNVVEEAIDIAEVSHLSRLAWVVSRGSVLAVDPRLREGPLPISPSLSSHVTAQRFCFVHFIPYSWFSVSEAEVKVYSTLQPVPYTYNGEFSLMFPAWLGTVQFLAQAQSLVELFLPTKCTILSLL